jgi:hypothetical protein
MLAMEIDDSLLIGQSSVTFCNGVFASVRRWVDAGAAILE